MVQYYQEGTVSFLADEKWIQSNMNLFSIDKNSKNTITVKNSAKLDIEFYRYACNFYKAAEYVFHFLEIEAAQNHDIAKLDTWYFSLIYLYRQSLELMLKAIIFQNVMNTAGRKQIIGKIRHDLEQAFDSIITIRKMSLEGNSNAKWLKEYLSDISRIDIESDMFRYPFGNNFKLLFEKQTHISLQGTYDNMHMAYKTIISLSFVTSIVGSSKSNP